MSVGEDRVRTKFNPAASSLVDQIKQKSAELIDLCSQQEKQPGTPYNGEIGRLWSIAMTHYEDAAMWAVKAATAESK